ncbi:lysophospholipid transporter LplT [Pelistega suis]|uniref:lysophospholipid transporter LplT n=1 Tax=Pelistega suis TaxID=1631957 RepID=UPI00211BAC85|nr:lysophospholipid transporter LplT [Pelistega suis]MCQ9328981.1 lysophospholipid transporter LplT [Pelistega suis]
MKKGFFTVMTAQALSSLADNALFIAAIALIHQLSGPDWLDSLLKWAFAASYVILAAFVGAIADSFPKGRVMFVTNSIKITGCLLMFISGMFANDNPQLQTYIICIAYGLVGIGAAAYSPAKYGIVTELLPPKDLVKGNSWIEGLTVLSIIFGFVLGGILINQNVINWFLQFDAFQPFKETPAEIAIIIIGFIYLAAAVCNLLIPKTHFVYPKQATNPVKLVRVFSKYVMILWRDKVGQISLAVTTLFWGAGAVIQLVVLKWGTDHLGLDVSSSAYLMGVAAIGTIIGAVLAGRIPLEKALSVLPVGVAMGLCVMLMVVVKEPWAVYSVLILVGGLSGFFVVPMNALLQHRGHVLLSAGHSIAVQNFNEQLNILLMVALYGLLVHLGLHINTIIIIFGVSVAVLMFVVILLCKHNEKKYPQAFEEIGDTSHGKAQHV